jgi:hypothetical protein
MLDICAAVLVLIVLVMPGRDLHVASGYRWVDPADVPQLEADVALAQAQALAHPSDGAAVERLAGLLGVRPVSQHDQALRLAGDAAARLAREKSATRWRALLAISSVHADRIEIADASRYAAEALAACEEPGADCPPHEKLRLELYAEQMAAGVEAMARGADPRADPDEFRRQMGEIHPTTTFRVRAGAGSR